MVNEEKLDNILLELGHDDFNKGTAQLRQAVKMYEPGMMLTKELYPALGRAVGSTASRVERNMRHSIQKAWGRGAQETQARYFGGTVDPQRRNPTVGEYVARLHRLCKE